jgi:hydrogenase maturation protease
VASKLILYMGNPIVKNDQVGLIAGAQIAAFYRGRPDVEVREFSGSPLDLVSDVQGYDHLILIDSISTGEREIGSVAVFGEDAILAGRGDVYLHGMNLSEALKLCRRMQLPLKLCRRMQLPFPGRLHLVGIEAGVIYEFDEELSAELRDKLPAIISEVQRTVGDLISSPP